MGDVRVPRIPSVKELNARNDAFNTGWRNGVRAALQARKELAEDTQCDCNRCVLEALGLDPDEEA